MRHAKKFNHLGRKTAHRKAMLANMACSIIEHKRIFTTLAKAKAMRVYLEPLLTKAKTNTTHNRRTVFSNLKQKQAITELFDVIAPKIADRPGGYLRVIKTGFRPGDAAEMAMIELVDFNDTYTQAKEGGTTKKKRSRRGGSKKKATNEIVEETTNVVEEAVEEVVEEVSTEAPKAEEVVEEVVEETAAEETTTEEPEAEESAEDSKEEE